MTGQRLTEPGKLSELARHVVLPSGIVSTGWPAVRDRCGQLGIRFDSWQDGAGRVMLAKRSDGIYASTIGGTVISIPRQVGKTFLVGGVAFALCLLSPNLTVIWTAHRLRTAAETFSSMQGLAARKKVRPLVDKIVLGSGDEEIRFTNGSRILFGARERGFGRGFAEVDALVFDEAQILTENAIDDMVPATNQTRQPAGALLLFTGTPPKPSDPAEVFSEKRAKALSGESDSLAYIEFSADRGADPLDRRQWARANPSYPRRTPAEAMLRMVENLTPDSFVREGLGVWDDVDTGPAELVPMSFEAWSATALDVPREVLVNPTFFVTISKGMESASITAAAMYEGRPHVELADHRPGTAWLARRIRELADRYSGAMFGAFSSGPVKSWIPTLGELGVELKLLTIPETASACAHFQKLGESREFTHSPRDVFVESLRGARTRELDGGSWVWDWRKSSGDLAPVAGATGVLWLLESVNQHSDPGVYVF